MVALQNLVPADKAEGGAHVRWHRLLSCGLVTASLMMVVALRALAEAAGTQQPDERTGILEAGYGLLSLQREVFEAYKALAVLRLDVAEGRVSLATALRDVEQWKAQLKQLWEKLEDARDELVRKQERALLARTRWSTTWEYGAGAARHLWAAVAALQTAAIGIERMSQAVRWSDSWERSYDQAGAYLEFASLRHDLASLFLTLMRQTL